ncbi:hypothetical protein J437_LFUL001284 [Ladona fulva]|uniref:P-type domain-containing protein n=1 Tax=Ladona fulva TaxID=123851 RepID=A0A8K0JUP9_LADFU|nr:hypothetical protein J437_LFUL001284 [Ladona fulva]
MGKKEKISTNNKAEEREEETLRDGIKMDETVKKASFWDRILLNRMIRAATGIIFFGVVVPVLVYIFLLSTAIPYSGRSCAVYEEYRTECLPGRSPSPNQCIDAGCCWNATHTPHCYHSLPSYYSYRRADLSQGPNVTLEPLARHSSMGTRTHSLILNMNPMSKDHLTILLFDKKRYEGNIPNTGIDIHETAFQVKLFGGLDGSPPFAVDVIANGETLFSTSLGPLVASDQYWEITLKLPTTNVYGWGGAGVEGNEPPTLKLPTGPLPQWAGGGRRLAHPFLICLNENGTAHGIFFKAAGPLEIELKPSGLLALRAVINIWLEIHILAGPTPADVTRQLCEAVGYPQLPPYWALGLHVCRRDSSDAKTFFETADNAGLPFDSDCLGLRALGERAFEVQHDLLPAVKELKDALSQKGRKFLHVQFPQVEKWSYPPYQDGVAKDIFVRYGGLGYYFGTYNDRSVAYPSLLQPKTQDWFLGVLKELQKEIGPIEAIAIEDDSPLSNGTYGSNPNPKDDLPFIPRGLKNSISQGTLFWMTQHSDTVLHYTMHNNYGYLFTENLHKALHAITPPVEGRTPRKLILGEWTQPGTGLFGGHGGAVRVYRTWTTMRSAFVSALTNGLVGIPLSAGVAACGRLHTVEESKAYKSLPFDSSLCRRWIRLGAVLPLWRVFLPPGNVTKGAMASLVSAASFRYQILPYIYTQMYHASMTGMPVVRHLFFEYPEMKLARDADDQVLLGPALMVTPSFIPDAPTVSVFLPNGTWYSHPGGEIRPEVGRIVKFVLRRDEMPMFMRGGYIIPMQDYYQNAGSSRILPYSLTVALDCDRTSSSSCAEGELFVDDGETEETVTRKEYELVKFVSPKENSVEITRVNSWLGCNDPKFSTVLDSITIYGANNTDGPGEITIDGKPSKGTVMYNSWGMVKISGIGVDWCNLPVGGNAMTISWT